MSDNNSPAVPDAVKEVERRHIRARVVRLTVDLKALKIAIDDNFGANFDAAAWKTAFESREPGDVNTVSAVIGAYERIVNGLVEAARSGLVASGIARPAGTPEKVASDLAQVRDDGGLTAGQYDLLVALSRTRNELQHDYIEVSADDARDAVRRLLGNLPALVKRLNAWFGSYDVGVSVAAGS